MKVVVLFFIFQVLGGSFIAAKSFQVTVSGIQITFDRQLSGDRVGQHKVPPLSPVSVEIRAIVSSPVDNAILIDYFPNDWTVIDPNGGNISAHDSQYNKIEWSVSTVSSSILISYVIMAPQRTIPPTTYYFRPELTYSGGNAIGENWRVIVADPTTGDYITVDFSRGTHENTENVDNAVRLRQGYIQGRFTSRVFDLENVSTLENLIWTENEPTLFFQKNDNVGAEPTTLVDGSSRKGTVAGGPIGNTRTADGVYENIQEFNNGTSTSTSYNPSAYSLLGNTALVSGTVSNVTGNDNVYMGFRSYPSTFSGDVRVAENENVATYNASTTYQDRVVLTWTPATQDNYLIIATAEIKRTASQAGRTTSAQLTIDGTSVAETFVADDTATTINRDFVAFKVSNLTAAPHTIKIQYATTHTGNTATIKNARIIVMAIGSNFRSSEPAGGTTSSTTYTDIATLTFTPDITENWLILGHADTTNATAANFNGVMLSIDGENSGETYTVRSSASYYLTAAFQRVVSLSQSVSHSLKIQMKSVSGTVLTYKNVQLYAIPIGSVFGEAFKENSDAQSTTTLATPGADKTTLNFTPSSPGDYLILATGQINTTSLTVFVGARLTVGNTVYGDENIDIASTGHWAAFAIHKKLTLSGAQTVKISFYAQTAGTTVLIRNARIVALRLPTASGYTENMEFTGASNTYDWDNIVLTVDSQWSRDSVGATVQLYNYTLGRYAASGENGYLSYTSSAANVDETKTLTVTASPTQFRDASGNWKIRISGVKTGTRGFDLKVDWVDFKPTWTPKIYSLRWQHTIENVRTLYDNRNDNYTLKVKGLTSGDSEKIGIYIWKSVSSTWEFVDNLATAERTITKVLENIENYLAGNNVYVRYQDWDNTDNTQTTLHVDFSIVEENVLFKSEVKLRVRVSTDNITWSDNLGPDGTSNTYFNTSPASLTNIQTNRYIQYIVYFWSENEILSGASGPKIENVKIEYIPTPTTWRAIETWTGTLRAPSQWRSIESWTGTVKATAAWRTIETWTGTVRATSTWRNIETWTGTVRATSQWRFAEEWTGTVMATATWRTIETWMGTVRATSIWRQIETWMGTARAPARWKSIETWTGTVNAPYVWRAMETWTGAVRASVASKIIETWAGTLRAPASWRKIETWTGSIRAVGLPTSSVDAISPYWQTSTPFTITATASDPSVGGHVTRVTLWYRYSAAGLSWDNWENFGTLTTASWSWSFTAPNGDGHYEFYSRAFDEQYNREPAPAAADAVCGVDTQPPAVASVIVNGNASTTNSTSVIITIAATDNTSGVVQMQLSNDNVTWTAWENFDNAKSYALPSGDGNKTVYVRVKDNAGWTSAVASDSIELKNPIAVPTTTTLIGDIPAGSTGTADLTSRKIGFTKIRITTSASVTGATISVEQLPIGSLLNERGGAPIPNQLGTAYQFFWVIETNIDRSLMTSVRIEFRIDRDWIMHNNIDERTITIYRLSGAWQELSTQYLSADGSYFYYEALSSGTSIFIAVGKRSSQVPVFPVPTAEEPNPSTSDVPPPSNIPSGLIVILMLTGMIASLIIAYSLSRPKNNVMFGRFLHVGRKFMSKKVGEDLEEGYCLIHRGLSNMIGNAIKLSKQIRRELSSKESYLYKLWNRAMGRIIVGLSGMC